MCYPSELKDGLRTLGQLEMQATFYEEQHTAFQLEFNKHVQQMTKFQEQFQGLVRKQQSTFDSHKSVLRALRAHVQKLLEEIIQLTNQLALNLCGQLKKKC